jgi:hypothetical protein
MSSYSFCYVLMLGGVCLAHTYTDHAVEGSPVLGVSCCSVSRVMCPLVCWCSVLGSVAQGARPHLPCCWCDQCVGRVLAVNGCCGLCCCSVLILFFDSWVLQLYFSLYLVPLCAFGSSLSGNRSHSQLSSCMHSCCTFHCKPFPS